MRKRITALFLTLLCLCTSAMAEYYIANPNPADRLHLRQSPSSNAKSLGKYYNGAPIEALGAEENGWVRVRVGMGTASQTGYMNTSFLVQSRQADAMPQYIAYQNMTGYTQPAVSSHTISIPTGRLVSMMGLIEGEEDWYHLMIHTQTSEGSYFCFLPESGLKMNALGNVSGINAYISNPDKRDRLHLRAQPSKNAKSLGKFYNGTVGTVLGFADDGQWVKVKLYGQVGYMAKEYLCLEGEGPNRTHYGIPTVSAVGNSAKVYADLPDTTDNYEAILSPGTQLDVLGLIGDHLLQVRLVGNGDRAWYIYREDTDFVDTRYQ